MKNGILIEKCSFHVDEANRVVICTLECDMQLRKHPAYYSIDAEMIHKRFPNVRWGCFTVTAKARCSPEDTFDATVGKRIAESRAKSKMFNIAGRVYRTCSYAFARYSNTCYNSSLACDKSRMVEDDHILDLIR